MQDSGFLQQFEGEQQLLRVTAHRFDVQPDVLAVLFQDFSQIHGQRLKHHAQVLFVEKMTDESQTVHFIVRVCVVELFQNVQLLQSSFMPAIYSIK